MENGHRGKTVELPFSNTMTESEEFLLLDGWATILEAQRAKLNARIVKQTGHAYVIADTTKAAFLELDEELTKPAIEEAVATFIRTNDWPDHLTERECLHLIFRINVAKAVIKVIRLEPAELAKTVSEAAATIKGSAAFQRFKKIMPDLENREQTIHWFLVYLWDHGGKALLALEANRFLEPAPVDTPSGRPEILIHASLQKVKAAIMAHEIGIGERLESESKDELSFWAPGAPGVGNLFGRSTYRFVAENNGVRVFMLTYVIANYGTASESVTPVDEAQFRIACQNRLAQIKAAAEKSSQQF